MKAGFCNLLFKRIWLIKTIKSANTCSLFELPIFIVFHKFVNRERDTHTETQYDYHTLPSTLRGEGNYDLHVYEWLNLQDIALEDNHLVVVEGMGSQDQEVVGKTYCCINEKIQVIVIELLYVHVIV